MNMKTKLMRFFAALAMLTLGLTFASCTDDDTTDNPLSLYYMEVSKIAPSMTFTVDKPSFKGPRPSEFAITGITLDGAPLQTDCFVINESTGAVDIVGTDNLVLGTYRLSISCKSAGARRTFADALVIHMVPPVPEELAVEPANIKIAYADLGDIEYDAPTAQVSPVGTAVTVRGYSLEGEGSKYFKISSEGVISVNRTYEGEVLPGIYDLDVVASTYANQSTTFKKAMRYEFQSKPLDLTYEEDGDAEAAADYQFRSEAPVLKGSPDAVRYEIVKITPVGASAATTQITIDAATGEILIAANNTLKVDDEYDIDVKVTNVFGSATFENAYHIKVVAFIDPIKNFSYAAAEAVHYVQFTAEKDATFEGGSVKFTLETVPDALKGIVSIDEKTGAVTTPKHVSPIDLAAPTFDIPVGTHSVTVKAANKKGSQTATLTLTVVENPNYFSKFGYGNNISVDAATEADQFRFDYGAATSGDKVETISVNAALCDFPAGKTVKYAMKQAEVDGTPKMNPPFRGTPVNAATGDLSVTFRLDRANKIGAILVTATVGDGDDAVCRTIPVFVTPVNDNAKVRYAPFVLKANPKTGAKSAAPTFTAGVDKNKFKIDYVRDAAYYNLYGPATHVGGGVGTADKFLGQMWKQYFKSVGKAVSYTDRSPLAYDVNVANLSQALLYINNDAADVANQFRVIVNGVWLDAAGKPANGFIVFQTPYETNGNQPTTSTVAAQRIFPVVVWFDEKF